MSNEHIVKTILTEILFGRHLCESSSEQDIVQFFYEELEAGDTLNEKLLVGEPVTVPELRKILRNKILNFEFIKLDGEVRPARGTTMMKYVPKKDHPKGVRPSSPKVATFFDLEKKAWRSVSNRSKEIVLKYAYGEKGEKKPVFIVRDKEVEDEDRVSRTEAPEFSEPSFSGPVRGEITKDDIEDVDVIRKPEVDAVPAGEEEDFGFDDYSDDEDFGFDDDSADEFDEDEEDVDVEDVRPVRKPEVEVKGEPVDQPKYGWKVKEKPSVRPVVRPNIRDEKPSHGWKVKPKGSDEVEVVLPRETQRTFTSPPPQPTKEPPLQIDDEDELI